MPTRTSGRKFRFDRSVLAMACVPFAMVLGNSIIIPVLPAIKSALGLTEVASGLIITAFSIPAGVLIPFAGFLADRYGRKAVMVPSLVVYGIGGLVAAAAGIFLGSGAFGLLMVGRVIQGLGAAGTANIGLALAGDLYSGAARGQAMGVLEASNGFGKVASPILGAALGLLAWFAPFLFFASLTIPVALAVALWVKEAKPPKARPARQYFGSVLRVFSRKGLALGAAFASAMVALFLLFGVLFYLSTTLEKAFGLEGVAKGLVLALPVLASAAASYVTGAVLQERVDRRHLVSGGLALIALALGSLAVIRSPHYLYAAIFLIGAGSGAALAALNTLVTSSVPRSERGMITSDYGAVRFFGVALGPPLFGLVMGRGEVPLFLGAAALAAATAVAAVLFVHDPLTRSRR